MIWSRDAATFLTCYRATPSPAALEGVFIRSLLRHLLRYNKVEE